MKTEKISASQTAKAGAFTKSARSAVGCAPFYFFMAIAARAFSASFSAVRP